MANLIQQDAKKALAKLFLCYPLSGDESERQAKLQAYWEVLEGREPRFVIEACEYAAKGKVGEGRFLPTAAELFNAAEAFSAREVQRKHVPKIEFLQQNDPATRQRIIDGFANLLSGALKKTSKQIDPLEATKEVFCDGTNVLDSVDRHNRQRVERAKPIDHSKPPVIGHLLQPYLHDRRPIP
jgi:hypothetical protein